MEERRVQREGCGSMGHEESEGEEKERESETRWETPPVSYILFPKCCISYLQIQTAIHAFKHLTHNYTKFAYESICDLKHGSS